MLHQFKNINTIVLDVDGVLTDGTLLVMPGGLMVRRMNIKDGYALQLAVKKGYHIAVISGGDSAEVKDRLQKLGITDVYMKVQDKLSVLNEYMILNGLDLATTAYMGDDIPDYEVMKVVGLPACPADAAVEIKSLSAYVSPVNGGAGCVRDLIEKIMRVRGDWTEDASVRAQ
jgi:3-deoxy-D-manno-octulosonate 8-phosphate phosphatase (KDO 8-P phosphatase)